MLEEIFENKYYKLIKENLSAIILIPTILGGLQQIISLSLIGVPYIRFFSISQVIPDGLLIIWTILIVGLLTYTTHIFFKKILTPIIEVWFTKLVNKILKRNGKIETEGSVFYLLSILLIGILALIGNIIFKGSTYISFLLMLMTALFVIEGIIQFFDRKERLSLIVGTVIVFIFITNALYNSPQNLINSENMSCMVANKNIINKRNLEIRYMNDKYIFMEIKQKQDNGTKIKKIEVITIDEFFNIEKCY